MLNTSMHADGKDARLGANSNIRAAATPMPAEMEALDHTIAIAYKRVVDNRKANGSLASHERYPASKDSTSGSPETPAPISLNELCRSCYEIKSWFSPPLAAAGTGSRHICDLKMAFRDRHCPLCSFLFTIATNAAALSSLPGHPCFGMYALHVSSFSEVFFHAEDHCWFPDDGNPPVYLISPLYHSGAKARDWALQHNSCFMLTGHEARSSPAHLGTSPCARALSPRADLESVRAWVSHCEREHTHPDCNASWSLELSGFHVIDCEQRRLVVCPSGRPYVTLSYVWGDERAEAFHQDGHDEQTRIPATLPKLIEDAMQVALGLGYQYLWVDRYCIPQGDEVVRASLIQNMDKIYAESSITIIATASNKPSDGLIGISAPRTDLPMSLTLENLHFSQLITNLADEVEKSRWNTRGWTYQEGFLSNKRLLFTKSQCYFQCGQLWCTEGLRISLDTLTRLKTPCQANLAMIFPWVPRRGASLVLSTEGNRRRQMEDYFVDRVREYMLRELTHDADAFNAFAGVLNYLESFAEEFLLGNIFGLPIWSPGSRWSGDADARNLLLYSLSWSLSCLADEAVPAVRSCTIPAERRQGMPSWTWCGWKRNGSSSPPTSIAWHDTRPQAGSVESELIPDTQVAVEYDGQDASIPWTSGSSPADLLASDKAQRGSPGLLRVHGWTSQLLVPDGCWNDGPQTCQCGPYRMERRTARYLSTAARRRGLPSTGGGHTLRIWFFSPLSFSATEDNCCGEVMVLIPKSENDVYERLEALCEVKMEYFIRRPSVEDLACRFGWSWTEFQVA